MAKLHEIVKYCDALTDLRGFPDYPGAYNGLQIENGGVVTHVGASVDAGMQSFEMAVAQGVDLLIVHHGAFWSPAVPVTGLRRRKLKFALDHNLALYSNHLPLDAHPELGNNARLARLIGLEPEEAFGSFEDRLIGWYASFSADREELNTRLSAHFPRMIALEHGTNRPRRIGIMTGSGGDLLPKLRAHGIDTLITGEGAQHHFNMSQELGINLYLCGHYATEVFGVQALASSVADKFDLPWSFIDTHCPL